MPSAHFEGVVVDSYEYRLKHRKGRTYAEMRHDVRVSLAGRAAEELVFGPERVSNGAASDPINARYSSAFAFAYDGFAPSMEKEKRPGSNLLVTVLDGDETTPSEWAHIEELQREFLAVEYSAVIEMVAAHRPLLDAIANRMMQEKILSQDMLKEMVRVEIPGLFAMPAVTPHLDP